MAKSQRTLRGRAGKTRAVPAQNKTGAPRTARQVRSAGAHASPVGFAGPSGWASDLEFDIREPKLAVSLRLDADVPNENRALSPNHEPLTSRSDRGQER